jgi:hypothetical protein
VVGVYDMTLPQWPCQPSFALFDAQDHVLPGGRYAGAAPTLRLQLNNTVFSPFGETSSDDTAHLSCASSPSGFDALGRASYHGCTYTGSEEGTCPGTSGTTHQLFGDVTPAQHVYITYATAADFAELTPNVSGPPGYTRTNTCGPR